MTNRSTVVVPTVGGRPSSNCSNGSPLPSCFTPLGAVASILVIICIVVVIVVGNFMVVLAVKNEPKLRRQRQNWLIVSLAVADLLVGAVVMPLSLSYEVIGQWWFGDILCELWLALDVLFVTASILHICVISLDRYWSVTQPLSYPNKRTATRIGIMIGVSWVVSLSICLPPLFGWRRTRQEMQCTLSTDVGYVLYSALGSFYLPVIILVLVYARIYAITRQHSRQRLKETERADNTLARLAARSQSNCSSQKRTSRPSNVTTASDAPYSPPSSTKKDLRGQRKSTQGSLTLSPLEMCRRLVDRRSLRSPSPIEQRVRRNRQPSKTLMQTTPPPPLRIAIEPTVNNRDSNRVLRRRSSADLILPATTIPAPYADPIPEEKSLLSEGDSQEGVRPPVTHTTTIVSSPTGRFVKHVASVAMNDRDTLLMNGMMQKARMSSNATTERGSIPQHMQERRRRLKQKERQATLLLGLILTAFIASWLPFFAMYVLGAFNLRAPEIVFKVFFWLGYCNSGINPIIYTLFNREFRKALCKQINRKPNSKLCCFATGSTL